MPDPDGVVLDHLGDAYLACHKQDKARDAWQRAVTALKKQEETAKAQAVRGQAPANRRADDERSMTKDECRMRNEFPHDE